MKKVKKAQDGENLNLTNSKTPYSGPADILKDRQYKRLGRLAAKNKTRAKKVAGRMAERATRETRGKEYFTGNISKLVPGTPKIQKKGGTTKKSMKSGGKMSKKK